ncbi:ATP-binding protein [Sphingobium sp. sgz301303]
MLALALLIASPTGGRTPVWSPSAAFATYTHQKWGRERDAPKQVYSLAQGRDGYLWLATVQGLYRFDGARFEHIQPPRPSVEGHPSAVLVARNGDVWVNFAGSHRFAIYRNGVLKLLPPSPVTHRVSTMREGPDGAIWVLSDAEDDPLFRYRDGRWKRYGRRDGIPSGNPFDMVVDAAGAVWLTHASAILRLDVARDRFSPRQPWNATVARMAIDPVGRVWLSTDRGSYPITGEQGRGASPKTLFPYMTDRPQIRGFTIFDRDGNLWVATEYRGVQRVQRPSPRGASSRSEASAVVERFTEQNGLTSNVTERLLQDVEGNIWVGTEKGIDRFRRASVVAVPKLRDPHVFGDQLLAARDGSVFIAEASRIYRVTPGDDPKSVMVADQRPSTICEAPNRDVWVTLYRTVYVLRNGRLVGTRPNLPTDITVYDCAFDARGDYWISVARGGLYRLRGQRWERMFGTTGPDFRPRSMIADRHGRVLAQWSYRTLRYVASPDVGAMAVPFSIQDPQPVTLYTPPRGVGRVDLYVGGPDGVARLLGGRWQQLRKDRLPSLVNINGIVVTREGDHWIAGSAGIIKIPRAEAEAAFSKPAYRPRYELFNEDSGLSSLPHDHSRRSIVQGGDGRIWIATQSGVAWIDPTRLARNMHPPKLWVSGVRVGNRSYRDPKAIRLKAGESDIEIDFSVLSLSNPDRTEAMYMLEGQDDGWTSSGRRREAFYTNLVPGRYRFRVVGMNEDGIENRDGAWVDIEVVPTFVQSIWFPIVLAVAAVLILWFLLRLRSAQVAAQMRGRLEQRLMERETIARDLHDTLLQGVQGFMFRIQAIANRLAAGSEERRSLEEALDRADDLVMQGRDSVRDLRVSDMEGDLRRTLQDAVDDALLGDAIDIQIVELGSPREIHPLALAEIKAIVGEALFNIGRHAGAAEVELVASYGRRSLRLRVHDDGRGIPKAILDSGRREGHFGLVGMRERAQVIGGSVLVRSQAGEGTEVVLDVPAGVAYRKVNKPAGFFSRLWPL